MQKQNKKPLLQVSNLRMHYPLKEREGGIFSGRKTVKAVEDISFDVYQGETLGIVGESGCGKSTTGKMIVKLLEPTGGSIEFDGRDIFFLNKEEEKEFRKQVQIIFQDPFSSLDPHYTVGRVIGEPLYVQGEGNARSRKQRVLELMAEVGLREEMYDRYPHEFSGGQRQRIGVARALALNPSLIVCDEPVSALDVSIQAQILNLMKELQRKHNLTYIFISHNLLVVKHICDRIAVMYLGHIVEMGTKEELFERRLHPYTQALFDAIPVADPDVKTMQGVIKGDIPSPSNPPKGCPFSTRCPYSRKKCMEEAPPIVVDSGTHQVACHFYKDLTGSEDEAEPASSFPSPVP